MPISTFVAAPYFLSTWALRSFGSQFEAALTSIGLVKTTDTGQINWSSVNPDYIGTAVYGYNIFRFDDPLQDTTPCFIKFEYGAEYVNGLRNTIRISIGSGSNGSGSINPNSAGFKIDRAIACTISSFSGNQSQCVIAGNTSRLSAALFNEEGFGFFFNIERSKNSSGDDTADGITLFTSRNPAYGDWALSWYYPANRSNIYSGYDRSLLLMHHGMGSGIIEGNNYFYPCYYRDNQNLINPSIGFLGYFKNDITRSVVSVPIYGKNRDYLVLGTNGGYTYNDTFRNGNTSLALLYE